MIASLPMYDLPELRAATDAWWTALAARLRAAGIDEVPVALRRDPERHGDEWDHPGLLLSQCCGADLVAAGPARLTPLATPVYTAPGCSGPAYRSLIVVRRDDPARRLRDLRGRRAVVNTPGSHSGCNALRYRVAPLAGAGQRFFGTVTVSGGHAESLRLVAAGEADVAAIDCVTFALLGDVRPDAVAGVRVLAHTPRAPGLPLVARADLAPARRDALHAGLRAAFADPRLTSLRRRLRLAGLAFLPASAYHRGRIPAMARRAVGLGYPELR